jgi:hypothetical protein
VGVRPRGAASGRGGDGDAPRPRSPERPPGGASVVRRVYRPRRTGRLSAARRPRRGTWTRGTTAPPRPSASRSSVRGLTASTRRPSGSTRSSAPTAAIPAGRRWGARRRPLGRTRPAARGGGAPPRGGPPPAGRARPRRARPGGARPLPRGAGRLPDGAPAVPRRAVGACSRTAARASSYGVGVLDAELAEGHRRQRFPHEREEAPARPIVGPLGVGGPSASPGGGRRGRAPRPRGRRRGCRRQG